MKTLFCLVLAAVFVAGCGGDAADKLSCTVSTDCATGQACHNGQCVLRQCTTSTDCTNGLKCDLGVCVAQQCWSDNDCAANNKCLDGACIYKPECTVDKDCTATNNICYEYKCTDYVTLDPCYGQPCDTPNAMCAACGVYTTCVKRTTSDASKSTCEDACAYSYELQREDYITVCTIYPTCGGCPCTLKDETVYSEPCSNKCCDYIPKCGAGSAAYWKAIIEDPTKLATWRLQTQDGLSSYCKG